MVFMQFAVTRQDAQLQTITREPVGERPANKTGAAENTYSFYQHGLIVGQCLSGATHIGCQRII